MPFFGVLLVLGLAAMAADDIADARKAVAADPSDYAAHFNLALALTVQHQDDEAVAEYRKTLELKPALYEADLNLGTVLLRDKKPADAVPFLKEAAEARPKETRPALYYAQALLDSGNAAEAEVRFAALAGQTPPVEGAQLGLARALMAESKWADAAAQFRALGDKNGLLQAAAALEKSGNRAEAAGIYKEFPDDAAVREHLGQLQIEANDAKAAVPNLEEAVRKSPTTANRLALADAYRMSKEPLKMLQQLQLASAADGGNYELHMAYGRALRDNHSLIVAAQQFNSAAKLRPDSVEAWNELASALIVSENYPEGLAALDRIRALGKEIPGDYFLRAITLDKLKKRPEAIAAYSQFLAADGGIHPDQEFQARQRIRIIESELKK
jgi:Tfp pilus assembly protein PilF